MAVRYEVELDLPFKDASREHPSTGSGQAQNVIECNCSHCDANGLVLAFVPPEQFSLLGGEDNLTEYRFNTERIAHLFCKTCGVQSFARGKRKDGSDVVSINVRCLDGVDTKDLTLTPVNGKDY